MLFTMTKCDPYSTGQMAFMYNVSTYWDTNFKEDRS